MTAIGTGLVPPFPDPAFCKEQAANSTIQSQKTWADDTKAQRDLDKRKAERYSEIKGYYRTFCDKCGIGIGPAHIERALYFYPVIKAGIYLYDDEKIDEQGRLVPPREITDVLRLCGSCAARLDLPASRRVISPADWTVPPLRLAAWTLIDFHEWLYRLWHECWQHEMPASIPCALKEISFIGSVKTEKRAVPPANLPPAAIQEVVVSAPIMPRSQRLLDNVQRVRNLSRKIMGAKPAPSFAV